MEGIGLNRLQTWSVKNPKSCTLIGLFIMALGLLCDHFSKDTHSTVWFLISHLFVIFGEVITVTFFLHTFIDQQQHEHFKQLLENVSQESKKELAQEAKFLGEEFNKLIGQLREQAEITITEINGNLFEAILKGRMPHQIVDAVIESNFFKTDLFRRDLKLSFDVVSIKDNELTLLQRTEFEIEYIYGETMEFEYNMPISISNTPLGMYELKEIGFKKNAGDRWKTRKIGEGIVLNGEDFLLERPITLQKNQKVLVFQDLIAKYKIGNGIVDNYFANHHTVNTIIEVNNLPYEYEFKLYPTFPSNNDMSEPDRTGTKISYNAIKFLVPGQGFGFSISKNISPS
ncbi:hypothetical protein [Mucilaginibacter psychrotolerans]|uniref:Uncharacterized protein n=1 Tax=Mucilaginibacter psychrotolerans TaxID=1524096 RepID=A0A4Y8S752_9SPHI|nr:hypothetical protein [Mucilaginibacter psychrotolerans]TFF34204.1 hypothetical protein E2R66_22735 [Mucilaginibacter psychrotolerans]